MVAVHDYCLNFPKLGVDVFVRRWVGTASFEVVYEGFVYRTLHQHLVDSREYANEAGRFRKVNNGWEVSPANEDSVKVCAQHAWGAHLLVFADGSTYVTASGPDYVHKYIPGSVPFFLICECLNGTPCIFI